MESIYRTEAVEHFAKYKDRINKEKNLKTERPVSSYTMTKRFSLTLSAVLSLGLVLLTWPATLQCATSSVSNPISNPKNVLADSPRQSNNLTDVVQWDNHSIFVKNQRIFL